MKQITEENSILDLFDRASFIPVIKPIAKAFGIETAAFLGEIAGECRYWQKRGELVDGFFYSTVQNVEENTTLSDRKQRTAINILKDAGIIEMKVCGLPPRRYFKINKDALMSLFGDYGQNYSYESQNQFLQNERINSYEMEELNLANRNANNNKKIIINNNNKELLYIERFDAFWAKYPKKVGKGEAKKSFLKIKPSDELLNTMLEAIDRAMDSQQWKRDGGQYVPNPATWLNQGRWEDSPEVEIKKEHARTREEYEKSPDYDPNIPW